MDPLKSLEKRIENLESEVLKVETSLKLVHREDFKTLNMLTTTLTKMTSELGKLIKTHHDVKQDLELKNEETRARINRLTGNVNELEDLSEIYSEIYGGEDKEW